MTCDILVVQISNCSVECIFNMTHDIYNYHREHLHDHTIRKIMLLKHALSEMINLKILNIEKLNKELKENDLFNVVDVDIRKKILIEEKKLVKTCSFGNNKMEKTTSRNQRKK